MKYGLPADQQGRKQARGDLFARGGRACALFGLHQNKPKQRTYIKRGEDALAEFQSMQREDKYNY
jgi:hypothetical protein